MAAIRLPVSRVFTTLRKWAGSSYFQVFSLMALCLFWFGWEVFLRAEWTKQEMYHAAVPGRLGEPRLQVEQRLRRHGWKPRELPRWSHSENAEVEYRKWLVLKFGVDYHRSDDLHGYVVNSYDCVE